MRYDEETKTFSLANNDPGDLSLAACAQFRCLWLDSQSQKDPELRQGRLMRPDVTHVVMGPQDVNDETLLYIQVDPSHPGAWRQEPVAGYLNDIISRGGKIEIMMGDISFRLDEMFQ